jgi:hypothetical protein
MTRPKDLLTIQIFSLQLKAASPIMTSREIKYATIKHSTTITDIEIPEMSRDKARLTFSIDKAWDKKMYKM